jgi:hypothetical protein
MAPSLPPPYRTAARSIYTAPNIQSSDAATSKVHSSSVWSGGTPASSAPSAPKPAIDQQGALLAQQAHAHSRQIASYNEKLQQLSSMNEVLFAAVKGMTISQAGDQRRIAEIEAMLQGADSDDVQYVELSISYPLQPRWSGNQLVI